MNKSLSWAGFAAIFFVVGFIASDCFRSKFWIESSNQSVEEVIDRSENMLRLATEYNEKNIKVRGFLHADKAGDLWLVFNSRGDFVPAESLRIPAYPFRLAVNSWSRQVVVVGVYQGPEENGLGILSPIRAINISE